MEDGKKLSQQVPTRKKRLAFAHVRRYCVVLVTWSLELGGVSKKVKLCVCVFANAIVQLSPFFSLLYSIQTLKMVYSHFGNFIFHSLEMNRVNFAH